MSTLATESSLWSTYSRDDVTENEESDMPKTPVEKLQATLVDPNLDTWLQATFAVNAIQSDWEYANGPLRLAPKYEGQHGYWL